MRRSLLAACLILASVGCAETNHPASNTLQANSAAAGYPYLVTPPRLRSPKPPLLIFLHGSGERGNDFSKVLIHGPTLYAATHADFPFLIISPQTPIDEWDPRRVLATLDDVLTKYDVDRDRIYLTGLSLGGYGTYSTGVLAANRFAALLPIAGEVDVADAAALKDIPLWVVHGEADDAVDPQSDYQLVTALRALHGRVRFTPYPGEGHNVWTRTYDDPATYAWLLAQRRGHPTEPRTNDAGTRPSMPLSTMPFAKP